MQYTMKLRAGFGRVLNLCGLLAGITLMAVMVLVVANALLRYLFNTPVAGTLELTEGALPIIVFLSLAMTQYEGGHIKVVLLTRTLPQGLRRAAVVLAMLAGAGLFAWATYAGWKLAAKSFAIGEIERGSIRYPLWPVKGAIAFGMALLTIQFLIDAVLAALGGALPDAEPEEIE
ncbi:TRAP transporter small permease [Sulfitobacter sp. PR48]|uniref:TRAP transporter small permease subunit n=1 Tax=unclassified Sulfitobacter TaxID=196795 RepID=UPI0022B04E39|nr:MULTISPECIES: TRAP transporter small permease [unclassified Sulfitobacter]MCZ4253942.1 TRAP transporter small permease [Sulfitobacter sp. G21635-S1]MDD9720852.1 TRAP transporter small permease [Sulfitobacter sp. PR48]